MAKLITGRVRGRTLARISMYKGGHFVSFPLHSRLSLALDIRALGPFQTEARAVAAARAALADPARRAQHAALLRADRARQHAALAHYERYGPT